MCAYIFTLEKASCLILFDIWYRLRTASLSQKSFTFHDLHSIFLLMVLNFLKNLFPLFMIVILPLSKNLLKKFLNMFSQWHQVIDEGMPALAWTG